LHLSLYAVLEQGRGALGPKWESDPTAAFLKASFLPVSKARKPLSSGKGTTETNTWQIQAGRAVQRYLAVDPPRISARAALQGGWGVNHSRR